MPAWTTLRAPNVGDLVGKFSYTTPEKISKWHERHPAYIAPSNMTVQQKWGQGLSLLLAVSQGGVQANSTQYKKKVVQKKYVAGQSQVLETTSFWLPVLWECDPIYYESTNTPWNLQTPRGSSTGALSNAQVNVLHLPLVATLNTITDTYRLGQISNVISITAAGAALRLGSSGAKPGVHVSTFGGFDYYWSDDTAYPDIMAGTVTSTGPAKVLSGNGGANPYGNTVFNYYGKSSEGAKLYPGKDLGQLYEWSSIQVNGKTVYPGTAFISPGQASGQYIYSAYAIKNTSDPEQPAKLCPIIVLSTDYTTIQNWKNASATVAVAPNVAAAVGPTLDLNQYMDAGKTTFATGTVNGVQTVQSWNGTAGAQFVNKYIVYPQYKFNKVGGVWNSVYLAAVDSQARFTAVGLESTASYQPATGKHLGAYNTLSEANQWRDYYNSIIKAKIVDTIHTLNGFVFVLGQNWNDGWGVAFNVEGLSGIRSKDNLSKFFNTPKVLTGGSDDAVDLSPNEESAGVPSIRVTTKQAVTQITKDNVKRLITSIMATEKLTFKQAKEKFKEEFIKARIKLLVSQGIPRPTAVARANARANVLFDNVTRNSNPGGAGTNGGAPGKPTTIRIPITRGLIGYQPPPAAEGTAPQLVQKYQYVKVSEGENGAKTQTLVPTERRFIFPFAPKDVAYSGLSSVWTEINRTGRHPIVDWSGFQLLKVSFTFELVDRTSSDIAQPRDGFGFYFSVDEKINLLRQMATAPYPVSFLNMDTFFDKELRYPLYTQGRGVEFVITDFAVQSVQRTPPSNEGPTVASLPNQISRASCTMTLQECPIEQVDIVAIPPIEICPKKKCPPIPCKEPCTEIQGKWLTIAELLQT
jgi:hypothetical protein